MRSRAAPRRGSRRSRAATPVSWACRCTRRPRCSSGRASTSGPEPDPEQPATAPMQDIWINWAPQEPRVAVVENGAVQELHIERTLERGRVGNIYTGKVARVLPGMQSAFVEIGLERAAFLHTADVHVNGGTSRGHHSPGGVPPPPIERIVFRGQ